MQIPPDAVISPEKISEYLLVAKRSGDKSRYLALSGFTRENAPLLESEIRRLSLSCEADLDRESEYGIYYNVTGTIVGPAGVPLAVKLVWLQRLDGIFSFVTLIPQPRSA